METNYDFINTMNFTASEFALGRQRCRKWVSLITQQLRLRHVYQIYVYNIQEDKKADFYFTLHSTPMSCSFYTSEKVSGKNLKWNELLYSNSMDTNASSVVIRIWKNSKKGDKIVLTWGVNFSGLVYLGNKIADIQPKFFKANTVIFFMQGVYFTSQDYIKYDLDKPLPFQNNLNLIETSRNEQVLYRRIAVKIPKGEVTESYNLEKLRRLQELQRRIKNKKTDVQHVKENIKNATERERKQDTYDPHASAYSNNIRFAPQLLTMNSLNKMLHEKPTKAEREAMAKVSKKIEECRFRLRLLHQERDRKSAELRRLKKQQVKLEEENEEKNSNLMSLYHALSKESQKWDEYKHSLPPRKEFLMVVSEQLKLRQQELLRELLFIYPIDKMPNEHKYTMLGIHLPDSETLLDYQDPGVSVVLGYICHILIMCSIFLQIPLRHPMKHYGSRSVIYNQVYPDVPDKEREFPLYTKGKDRAHFSYAVFLLNKNISQLRWYFHHKFTLDLKETLKHLRNLLLGDDSAEYRHIFGIREDLRRERHRHDSSAKTSPKKRVNILKSTPKRSKKAEGSNEVLAVPEAYLNKQISKDLFHRCASGEYKFGEKSGNSEETVIKIREGVEEFRANVDASSAHSDSIEEGTDPLDPSTNLESFVTKSIDINTDQNLAQNSGRTNENGRISRSMDSYVDDESTNSYSTFESSSDRTISASCDRISSSTSSTGKLGIPSRIPMGQQKLLEKWLMGDLHSSNELVFPEECLRVSLQDISSPLTERTDRLLSTNQSFNLVKHRPME